jgi:hypothetical protein
MKVSWDCKANSAKIAGIAAVGTNAIGGPSQHGGVCRITVIELFNAEYQHMPVAECYCHNALAYKLPHAIQPHPRQLQALTPYQSMYSRLTGETTFKSVYNAKGTKEGRERLRLVVRKWRVIAPKQKRDEGPRMNIELR